MQMINAGRSRLQPFGAPITPHRDAIMYFFDPNTLTKSWQDDEGVIKSSAKITAGFSEFDPRLQLNKKDGKPADGMLGIFGKMSLLNFNGKVGIGNDDISLYFFLRWRE